MAANELITDSVIAKEALMIVENNLAATRLINRRYEKKFAIDGNKIGDTINIRLPVRWEGRDGELMIPEGARERSIPLKIDRVKGQDLEFSNFDLTLKVDQFRERYLDTAAASIANRIDVDVCQQYKKCPNFVGIPATVPADLDVYINAGVLLSNYGTPTNKRAMVISPRMQGTIIFALKGLFNAVNQIGEQYRTAIMGHVVGFDWLEDQNVQAHTVGALGNAPITTTAGQSGSSILTSTWTGSIANRLNEGDIVTMALCNGVNPMSKDDTGDLRQFAITENDASDGAGLLTMTIFPAIVLSGPYQNVTPGPGASAAIKTFGAVSTYGGFVTKQGLAFHKEWLTAAFVPLDLPKNMEMAARAYSDKLGMSIRIIKGYDIRTNQQLTRLDVAYGLKQTYEDFCCRIAS